MIQPIKHFGVNWVDGMKISQEHFNSQENFLIDMIRDSGSIGLNSFNYGLLPLPDNATDRSIFEIYNTSTHDVQLQIRKCSAVTMAGYRLELNDLNVSVRSLAKNLHNEDEKFEGEFYLMASVNPFDKEPFGEIDSEEIPPRHPHAKPKYHLDLVDVGMLSSNQSGGNYLVLGKVDFRGGIAQVDNDFIPPCTSVQSFPKLMDLYYSYVRSVSNLQQYAFRIIQKNNHKDQNTALAENVKYLCRTMITTLGDNYFELKNIAVARPPVFLVTIFSKLAIQLYSATQMIVSSELEEMLNYNLEWSEVSPHVFLNSLSAVAEVNYDHHNSGEAFANIQKMLRNLETVFSRLSELDYIGQKKENIIVNEQEVRSNTDPKRGWSVID